MQANLAQRAAGLLLHVTSLPGPYYSGDLGGAAPFLAQLAKARQRWWQMLPVNPIGAGFSPYSTISSFAGEPLLVDLAALREEGLLTKAEVAKPAGGDAGGVRYKQAAAYRLPRLRRAFERAEGGLSRDDGFQTFRQGAKAWLPDFALFCALARRYATTDWAAWPAELRDREANALAAARAELAGDVRESEFIQYLFHRQWKALRASSEGLGVALMGDLPIFVSHGSADCWANAGYFLLGADRRPAVVAGCPPDAFNPDGQLWGNALYDWAALERDGFRWWIGRLGRLFEMFDAVRLDHFIGFARYWEIPASARTAREGQWRPAPGEAFFAAVTKALPAAQLLAEDLGSVSPEVRALRDQYKFPGMKVLQFGFDGSDEAAQHVAHRLPQASVVYTGTHDNPTTKGWYQGLEAAAAKRANRAAAAELARVRAYLGGRGACVHWDLIRAGYASPASLAIVQMQDVLGQGTAARMNTPGVAEGNWRYRMPPKAFSPELQKALAALTEVYDRA